jgi:hypothetical protein
MWLLTASVILFIVIVAMLIYANWTPSPAPGDGTCGGRCGGGCPNCPCNRCDMPKRRCGCGPRGGGGCPFC